MFNHRKPINQTIFANVFVPRIHQSENPSKSPSSNRSTWDGIHHDRGSSRDEPMGCRPEATRPEASARSEDGWESIWETTPWISQDPPIFLVSDLKKSTWISKNIRYSHELWESIDIKSSYQYGYNFRNRWIGGTYRMYIYIIIYP
jgi:hypothetical protein